MAKNITVIGATGLIGTPVTIALVKAGYRVTALIRDKNEIKAKNLPPDIHFVQGDLSNKDAIAAAVKNADGVYINLNSTPNDKEDEFNTEREGLDNILNVLKNSNVKQVALLSSFLARDYMGDWWVMKMKKAATAKLKSSGLPYTIFYSASFMQNFETSMRAGNTINTIGKPTSNLSWWISSEDFANQVAKAFSLDTAINREYSIQGPEGFTLTNAIDTYIKNNNKDKLKIANLPLGMGKFLALFIKPLKFAIPLIETIKNTNEVFEAERTWKELGKPRIDLKTFAGR